MKKMLVRKKLLSMVLVTTLMSVSCTSYKAVQVPILESHLKEGDTVRVVTTDNRDVRFKITNLTPDAIDGENQHILLKDIVTLEKQQISAAKTSGLVGGILVVTMGIIAAIAASQCCKLKSARY